MHGVLDQMLLTNLTNSITQLSVADIFLWTPRRAASIEWIMANNVSKLGCFKWWKKLLVLKNIIIAKIAFKINCIKTNFLIYLRSTTIIPVQPLYQLLKPCFKASARWVHTFQFCQFLLIITSIPTALSWKILLAMQKPSYSEKSNTLEVF